MFGHFANQPQNPTFLKQLSPRLEFHELTEICGELYVGYFICFCLELYVRDFLARN